MLLGVVYLAGEKRGPFLLEVAMRSTVLIPAVLAMAACSTPDSSGKSEDTDDTQVAAPCAVPAYEGIEGVRCEGEVAYLQGTFLEDLELTPDLSWVLSGGVFFGDGTATPTLKIPAGTTIYGDSATDGFLVINGGSRIEAVGTAEAPIVFTSDREPGSRARADWGGLIINGLAPTNVCEKAEDCPVPGEAGTGVYGGTDPEHSSGILRYVRIEFGGTLINDRQEINGLALQGVGRGTEIDFVHIHRVADDGIEMFGGTVDLKHIISTGAADDGFDWTDGWTGRAQFVVVQHYADIGDNGIEADNNKDSFELTPISEPTIRNMSILKSREVGRFADGYGVLLRAGTQGHLHQMLVAGYPYGCANVNDPATFDHGVTCDTNESNGALEFSDSWFACADTVREGEPFPADDFDFDSDQNTCDVDAFFRTGNDGNTVSDDHQLRDPFATTTPDWRPVAGGALVGLTLDADADSWFEATDFIGAVGEEDWTTWTTFPEN